MKTGFIATALVGCAVMLIACGGTDSSLTGGCLNNGTGVDTFSRNGTTLVEGTDGSTFPGYPATCSPDIVAIVTSNIGISAYQIATDGSFAILATYTVVAPLGTGSYTIGVDPASYSEFYTNPIESCAANGGTVTIASQTSSLVTGSYSGNTFSCSGPSTPGTVSGSFSVRVGS